MRTLAAVSGISINVSDPLVWDTRTVDINPGIATRVGNYRQSLDRSMGYSEASFSLSGPLIEFEDWIEFGLGRHIEVYNPALRKIFEGFVNRIDISAGGFQQALGPLTDVANQIVVLYQPLDSTADPPATGLEMETVAVTDDDSQALYGIWEVVYNIGSVEATGTYPEQVQDVLLGDKAYPPTTQRVNLPPTMTVTLSIQVVGYWAWATAYIFNDATPGTTTVTDKLEAILGADPNGIFSTDYSGLDANGALVAARERDNRVAWELIRQLVAGGDPVNYYRWSFGFYDDRVAKHAAIPTTALYQHKLSSGDARVTYQNGTIVQYYDILPGEWLFVSDYLPGRSQPTDDLVTDPRMLFIEQVRWSMPNTVEVNGVTLDNLPQLLAQQGLQRGIT